MRPFGQTSGIKHHERISILQDADGVHQHIPIQYAHQYWDAFVFKAQMGTPYAGDGFDQFCCCDYRGVLLEFVGFLDYQEEGLVSLGEV